MCYIDVCLCEGRQNVLYVHRVFPQLWLNQTITGAPNRKFSPHQVCFGSEAESWGPGLSFLSGWKQIHFSRKDFKPDSPVEARAAASVSRFPLWFDILIHDGHKVGPLVDRKLLSKFTDILIMSVNMSDTTWTTAKGDNIYDIVGHNYSQHLSKTNSVKWRKMYSLRTVGLDMIRLYMFL